MFPLSQQIFLPSTSAKVTGVAIADGKAVSRCAKPAKGDKKDLWQSFLPFSPQAHRFVRGGKDFALAKGVNACR